MITNMGPLNDPELFSISSLEMFVYNKKKIEENSKHFGYKITLPHNKVLFKVNNTVLNDRTYLRLLD